MNHRIQCIAFWSCIWWLLIKSHYLCIRWNIICLFTFSCAKRHFNASLLRLAETDRVTVASLEQRCQKGCLALSDLQLFNPFYASREYLLTTLKTNSDHLNNTGSINVHVISGESCWSGHRLQESLKLIPQLTVGQCISLAMPAWMGTGRWVLVFPCVVRIKASSGWDLVEISHQAVWGWRAELLTLLWGCSRVAVRGVVFSSKSLFRCWIAPLLPVLQRLCSHPSCGGADGALYLLEFWLPLSAFVLMGRIMLEIFLKGSEEKWLSMLLHVL